jgi:hypothetical protein
MEFIIVAILIGLLPAFIAQGKGKSFVSWWIYGALLFIVALPHALLLRPDAQALESRELAQGNKRCPFCAEIIKRQARVCRFCARALNPSELV